MNQICKVREFKQQEGQTSFPILLVDGTGSMYAEYEHVVDAWRQTFSPFGLNKLEFQWENGLFPLDEPFRSAGWGDITKTFDQVFDILQTQKMPKNITIIFVSDGQEDFDIDQLTEKIKLVTDQYIISFISIAIGSQFPNDISNNLYLQLHNSHRNFAPMYERERNFDSSIEEMEEYFLATFEEIKRQLSFCSVAYECDKPVKLTIVSQPTTRVTSGALFLTDSEVRINGEVVEPTNSEEDKKAIIVSSVQQALINYGSNSNKETIVKDFNIIKEISEKIYKPEKIETDQTFQAVQDFVESVTCNEIEFKLLSSEKLTKIQSNLTNPEKLSQVVQTITVDDPNNLETPVILKSFKKKVGACYIKGRSSLKIKQGVVQNESQCVAQIIKDTNEVIKNTLQSYLNKLQKEKPQDCKKLLREFYDVIQSKLNEFDKLDPRQITEEILEESTTMNQILEILSKLDQEKQLSWNYAFDEIKKALNEGNISSSMAIVDKQDDYKHLPFFQQGKNDDDWESIIIVIFDRNDKMKEYDLAFNLFNETFQNIEEEKLIKLTWRNNTFTIIDSENQQCDKLMDILRKFENSHGLREKKIFITVVSDGQTDYKTLHKNFKSAKSSFCNIRFIYVAVGMNFKVALENDIAKKFHNRDVKGKKQYYGFGQKKTFKIEIGNDESSDALISVIAQRIGKMPQELVVKCKRDQYQIKIIEGWPIEFYEFQENQNIYVEIRENETEVKQKESKRQTEKYLQKLFINQREKPQKLSAVSETSENSDDEENLSKQKSSNAEVQIIDQEDRIFQTVKSGNLEQLEYLSSKIDSSLLNLATFGGWNPIHFATFLEYKPIVEFLIRKDVDINKVTDEGWTPLQIAVHKHNLDIVRIILNHPQVDVNQITEKGIALSLACKTNQIQIIDLLITKNADPKLQDKTERNAFDYCSSEIRIRLQQKKNPTMQDQIRSADMFIPPRPPVAKGFIYKTGQMLVTLNERFFVLNPDEGTFIRFKNINDYPLKPLEIIPLKSVRSVLMAQKGLISKAGFHYFELLYSTRAMLACKHEHVAKKWVEYIYKATVYYQFMEDQLKENKIDPNLMDKNIEVLIEDTDAKLPSSDPPHQKQSPDQSINLPRDEATLMQKRLSNPEPPRISCSPPRDSEPRPKSLQINASVSSTNSTLDTSNDLFKDQKVNFDSFEVIRELGSGAFGKVFLVKHKIDGNIFAMKALKKKTLILKKQIKYAITEANVLKMCRHPFILGLHYAFQTPNYLYLVLDYCQGGDLSYHIANQGKFSEESTRFYAAEIILAIEFLHSKDIIYRDMKPENILLDTKGHVKLADFGLSKEGVADSDKAKSFCGSPAYLSPDMLSQKGAGKPSDIYGIGCVMYEMMTGESPYYNDDIQVMYKNIQSGTLKWPKKMSNEAKNLLTKMLERDPNKRIGTKSKDEIKQDPFFRGLDWDKVYNCQYKPPITDFSEMQEEDQDFENDELGYTGKAIFQDYDYDQENNRTNRVKNFSFATNTS